MVCGSRGYSPWRGADALSGGDEQKIDIRRNKMNTRNDTPISLIHEGMSVYDVENERIGEVDEVYFGAADMEDQELGTGPASISRADSMRDRPVADAIAAIFDPREVPDELAEKLLHSGYIRVDSTGLFAADRYILPDQIASVSDEDVHLSVSREQLITRR